MIRWQSAMIQNQLGRTLLMGFSQVAKSQKVRDYMVRGRYFATDRDELANDKM
jgi:hypothetical protein